MLRRALALTASALLGFAGVASAKLAAGPVTATAAATTPTTASIPSSAATTATTATASTATATTATTAPTTTPNVGATPSSSTVLVVSGHGWGHGVGMSQWGADGYAQHGWSYRQILQHYYAGTTVASHAAPPTVHVLLLEGKRSVTLTSDSPWKVVDASGTTVPLQPGPQKIGADLAVSGQALAGPLVFSPGATPLRVGKAAYRGKLMVIASGKKLQLVNTLPLESYLLGVVGEEMPHTWPAAALEAQAVAARTYALAELENVVTVRAYDLYGDTRSQVYGGIAGESPEVTAAVRATAHQAVLYGGKVATTYFFSSSGGRTVAAKDAWGKEVPYLVSVADPYDTLSPYHSWGPVLLDARKVARALKVPGDLQALDLTPDASGHVTRVSAVGTKGTVTLPGTAVRTTLGLRSTWFSVGWLSLTPPASPLAYGVASSLTGLARNVPGATLEVRSGGGPWQPVLPVEPGSDGSFSVGVDPTAAAEYRLSAGTAATAPVKVAVAPFVSATLGAGSVQGSVRPALAGALVQLQRQDGAGWRTVATATTDTAGAYAVAAQLAPGSYRVRFAPGHGLSPGVSQPILQS